MPNRTATQRLEAMSDAIKRGEAFRARVTEAADDVLRCADLMAEAVEMVREANGLEVVGRDGRATLTMEDLQAFYCLDAAKKAYIKLRPQA